MMKITMLTQYSIFFFIFILRSNGWILPSSLSSTSRIQEQQQQMLQRRSLSRSLHHPLGPLNYHSKSKRRSSSSSLFMVTNLTTTTTTTLDEEEICYNDNIKSNDVDNDYHLGIYYLEEDEKRMGEKKRRKKNTIYQKEEDFSSSSSSTKAEKTTAAAIFVNVNARGVTPKFINSLERKIIEWNKILLKGKEEKEVSVVKLYTTNTLEEARQAMEEVVASPPNMIIPIGGDGTLCTLLQYYYNHYNSSSRRKKLPLVGYIPMGTGNAVGSVVGIHNTNINKSNNNKNRRSRRRRRKRDFFLFSPFTKFLLPYNKVIRALEDMIQISCSKDEKEEDENNDNDMIYDFVDLPLLNVTTSTNSPSSSSSSSYITFFAGLGFDSLLLQDYQNLQEWTKKKFPSNYAGFFSGVWGYCVALVTRTLPKTVISKNKAEHKVKVQITIPSSSSSSSDTVWIDHRRGDVVRPIIVGDDTTNNNKDNDDDDEIVLYRGTTGIVAASTVPYYGGGLRLFPFASLYSGQMMQLRLGRIHPLRGIMNLPSIFKGSYRDIRPSDKFGVLDFIGNKFQIQVLDSDDDNNNNKNNNTARYPLQQAGESIGSYQNVTIQVLPKEYNVRFVTLLPPRIIYDD